MNANKKTSHTYPREGAHGYRSPIMAHDRRDLSIEQLTELNEIRDRAQIGMCTQEDLARHVVLEPYEAGSTMSWNQDVGNYITTWWIRDARRFSAPFCPITFPSEAIAQKMVNWMNYVEATKHRK